MRGRLVEALELGEEHRLIPAGAGQTVADDAECAVWGAHPRGCGADFSFEGRIRVAKGGSASRRAHPRGCGADLQVRGTFSLPPGSSPRVRGRQMRAELDKVASRLIPAGAGQTSPEPSCVGVTRAHPRGCGADLDEATPGPWEFGSSPRVRGRHPRASKRRGDPGLIPAGAGQTVRFEGGVRRLVAHPRGCGADCSLRGWRAPPCGSSPRVRGRQDENGDYFCAAGLIPAGAGQTSLQCCAWKPATAHPRGCGAD